MNRGFPVENCGGFRDSFLKMGGTDRDSVRKTAFRLSRKFSVIAGSVFIWSEKANSGWGVGLQHGLSSRIRQETFFSQHRNYSDIGGILISGIAWNTTYNGNIIFRQETQFMTETRSHTWSFYVVHFICSQHHILGYRLWDSRNPWKPDGKRISCRKLNFAFRLKPKSGLKPVFHILRKQLSWMMSASQAIFEFHPWK